MFSFLQGDVVCVINYTDICTDQDISSKSKGLIELDGSSFSEQQLHLIIHLPAESSEYHQVDHNMDTKFYSHDWEVVECPDHDPQAHIKEDLQWRLILLPPFF